MFIVHFEHSKANLQTTIMHYSKYLDLFVSFIVVCEWVCKKAWVCKEGANTEES